MQVSDPGAGPAPGRQAVLDGYRAMRLIREFEERVHVEYQTGKIPGWIHLYVGEEAVAAGVCAHLTADDYLWGTHRAHGHALAMGSDVTATMLELYGRKDGLCGGKGGSMHLADPSRGYFGANGIVGASAPLVCGAALAARAHGRGQASVAILSDGVLNQGNFLEALNIAAVWKLPCLFVIENNHHAQATHISYHMSAPDIATRAAGFAIPTVSVDGFDFVAVYEAAGRLLERVRKGEGPFLLECHCELFHAHFEGDTGTWRAVGEEERLRAEHDPLEQLALRALADGLVTRNELDEITAEAVRQVEAAVAAAVVAEDPGEEDLLSGLWVGPRPAWEAQL